MAFDTETIRAFLSEEHLELAQGAERFAAPWAARVETADDAGARREAREALEALGAAGWFAPIGRQDWRGCCLVREALAAASPLADAVFALQGLGTVPLLLAGNAAMRERCLAPAASGRAMAAFAMTEAEAGSDVSAMKTTARRDGDGYLLEGQKTFISNAGIADFYVTFASTDPSAGGKGISCFVVAADTPGLRFVGPQVLSCPHPLGTIAFERCRVPAESRLGEEGRSVARPQDARPPASHGGRRRLRHGDAGTRTRARARTRPATVRQGARRVPAGAGKAGADGHGLGGGAAARVPRGMDGRSGRRARHARGGDGEVVRHRRSAAHRG
jgi:acyl-CoA dehydrogenase